MKDIEEQIVELIRERGSDFSRADKRKLDELLVSHPDVDRSYEIEAAAHGALWLLIADPLYRGDMTLADLGEETSPDHSPVV